MADSVRTHGQQPTRLPYPWDSPGKNTGVGCHFLLQCMKVKSESEVAQSCPTLSDRMDCNLPGSSVHGICQARVLEWGAIAFSTLLPESDPNSKLAPIYLTSFMPHHGLFWASLVAPTVKNLPAVQETQVRSLGQKDPLEENQEVLFILASLHSHSSILAWRIP